MAFRKQEKKIENTLKQKIVYREKTHNKRIKHCGYRKQRYKNPYYVLLSDGRIYEIHNGIQFIIKTSAGLVGHMVDKLRYKQFTQDYKQYLKNKGEINEK